MKILEMITMVILSAEMMFKSLKKFWINQDININRKMIFKNFNF